MRNFKVLPIFAAVIIALASCAKDKFIHVSPITTIKYKIAVVLPYSEGGEYQTRLKSTVDFALKNMRGAQKYMAETGDSTAVDLDIEWYDEDSNDLSELAATLTARKDMFMIIGPLRNENVDVFAKACKIADIPLIVPCATSENIIRRYANTKSGDKAEKPFLWSLCETDVSQSEALLAKAWESGAKNIALLTPDDDYGQTFYEWIPFLATELGIKLNSENILQYNDDDLKAKAQTALESGVDCVICTVGSASDARTILEVKQSLKGNSPRILFSNGALSAYLLELGDLAEGAEGIAPYADPSTGFQIAYEERFGYAPAGAEAQVYDAILLAGLAAFVKQYSNTPATTNEILTQITSVGDESYPIWNELGLRSLMVLVQHTGTYVKLVGASGVLRFDAEAQTSLLQSTYVHWTVYQGQFLTIDFTSSDGSNRTASTLASWNWKAKVSENIEDQDSPAQYKELKDSWALLVQGSSGWENYRHQADVLNVYQMLKAQGWDDEHIILIISDDIAHNEKNKFPGTVATSTFGENLYEDAAVDYSSDTLSVSDIKDIMLGHRSGHLPVVLDTDEQSNVLVFWSGHGCLKQTRKANGFIWRGSGIFSDNDLRQTLVDMNTQGRYRKMLMLLEPCYSRTMAVQANNIPGILSIASAAENESSFADFHSAELGTWMSDRFSNNLVNTLSEKPNQTYKELYEYLYTHTLGSHVYIENSYWFGNLCKSSAGEFITNANQ